MKKYILLTLASLGALVPQMSGISVDEYRRQNGMPPIPANRVLDLSNKNITDLTGLKDIPGINKIRALYLNNNQLQEVPSGIFNNLSSLETLDLSANRLQTLHAGSFNGLYNLQLLNLSDNQLHLLPIDIFKNLTKLQFLYLGNNPFNADFISTLTEMILSIPQLKLLNGTLKERALREHPFSTFKDLIAKRIAKNINAYKDRLYMLPADLLNLLPLTREERAQIEEQQKALQEK